MGRDGPLVGWRYEQAGQQLGRAGRGNGPPDAKETSVTFNNTKANVNTQQARSSAHGVRGADPGESRVEFAQSAEAAAASASDAIESMRAAEYEAAVMKYFGASREKAEPAGRRTRRRRMIRASHRLAASILISIATEGMNRCVHADGSRRLRSR